MATLDPYFDPAGPFDRLKAYWWATACRVAYEPAPALYADPLAGLAGGTFDGREDSTDAQPMDFYTLETYQAVCIRGSDDVPDFLGEILLSGLVTAAGYPGQVSQYFADRTAEARPLILGRIVGPWLASGHSLGGAIAALTCSWPDIPPVACIDVGSPRSGSVTYAAAQNRPRLRVSNQTDPIPLVPILGGLTPPRFPWPARPDGYQHWGSRVHLWEDCSVTRPRGPDWILGGLGEWLLEIAGGEPAAAAHSSAEYARRIRGGSRWLTPRGWTRTSPAWTCSTASMRP